VLVGRQVVIEGVDWQSVFEPNPLVSGAHVMSETLLIGFRRGVPSHSQGEDKRHGIVGVLIHRMNPNLELSRTRWCKPMKMPGLRVKRDPLG
jgi:hypothetical protein